MNPPQGKNPEKKPLGMQNIGNHSSENSSHSLARDTLHHTEVQWLDSGAGSSPSPRLFIAAVLRSWMRVAAVFPPPTKSVPELDAVTFGHDALGAILEDLWAAERCLQPGFDVALLCTPPAGELSPTQVIGVMTGSARPHSKGFYIQGLSLHPLLFRDVDALLYAAGLLVESAIDVSLEAGLQGWVISSTTEANSLFWRNLGFSAPSGPFVKRMGYFDHPPLRRPG